MSKIRHLLVTIVVFLIVTGSVLVIHGLSASTLNNPPTAVNDSYTLHSSFVIGSLLANDTDPENNTMSVQLVTFPTHGSLSNVGTGLYMYSRSSSSWTGTDSFTYKACDGPGSCSSAATVTITVVNQAP